MTALAPAVLILSVVAVYLACEHRLRAAAHVQDVRDRDDVAAAWVASLPPTRMQALMEQFTAQLALATAVFPLIVETVQQAVDALRPFAAALAEAGVLPPASRMGRLRWRARRLRWWVADRWDRVVNDAVGGGSIRW